jgi:hypothetical protein
LVQLDQTLLTTKRLIIWGHVILSLEIAVGVGLVACFR